MPSMIHTYNTTLNCCRDAYDLRTRSSNDIVIERESGQAILSFREFKALSSTSRLVDVKIAGTNDILDLGHAAMICNQGDRHAGFYLHSLRLKKAIERHIRPTDIVYLYGHSLGGVCAQFLSLDIKARNIVVNSIGAPKGFRKPFDLPLGVYWNLWENDLDMIPEYPLTKPFSWQKMLAINPYNIHHTTIPNGDRGEPRGKWRKIVDILRPSLRSLSPRFTLDDTIAKYHALDHYESLSEHYQMLMEQNDE